MSIYKFIHHVSVYLFKKVKYFNAGIPTLPRSIAPSIKEFIRNNAGSKTSYQVLYFPKTSLADTDFNAGDNYIFKDFKKIISSRQGDLKTIHYPEVFYASMNDIIVSHDSGHFISEKAKVVFSESSVWKEKTIQNQTFYSSLRRFSYDNISEESTFLYSPDNYFHWLGEFLCRVFIFKKKYPDLKIYINHELSDWQKEGLSFFNINLNSIHVVSPQYKFSRFRKFTFISFLGSPEIIHVDVLKEVNRFVSGKLNKGNVNSRGNNLNRIYISREKALHRKVVNEEELISVLDKFGYSTIYTEDYNVEEKYQIFNNSESIIAVHGPSLTNIIACNKNTKVIELFNEKHIIESFAQTAFSLGLSYYAIIAESVGKAKSVINGKDFYGYNDIKVDVKKVESLLSAFNRTIYTTNCE